MTHVHEAEAADKAHEGLLQGANRGRVVWQADAPPQLPLRAAAPASLVGVMMCHKKAIGATNHRLPRPD